MNKNESIGPTSADLRKKLIASPYTWPGGYPLFAITDDGGCLCKDCCKQEADSIDDSCDGDEWHISAITVNWEESELYCDHCYERIESAYAEPEDVMEVHNKENES